MTGGLHSAIDAGGTVMARQFADGFRSLDQFSQRIDLEKESE